jgi:hypothetical protein
MHVLEKAKVLLEKHVKDEYLELADVFVRS